MRKTVFDFADYKKYLNALIRSKPGEGRGFRGKLADAIRCQRAFVSQVLSGDENFNLEHADRINQFLGHTLEESHFFMLLVQHARAGSEGVRLYFTNQMKQALNQRLILKNRLTTDRALSAEDQSRYYSAWYYGAVRVALAVPKYQTREALARRLGLSQFKIGKILEFLTSCGLAVKKGDRYEQGTAFLHLGNDSPQIIKHHSNWRVRAITALDQERPNDLHFSSVWSISESDALAFRAHLANVLEELQKKAKASESESIFSFCLDFFEI